MTRDDIITMAREADREWDCDRDMVEWLEWFAALVAASEREACAKVCMDVSSDITRFGTAAECVNAVLARG